MFRLLEDTQELQFYHCFLRFEIRWFTWKSSFCLFEVDILFSSSYLLQVKPPCSFTQKEIEYLTDRIQNGGTEVVEV